MQKKKQNKSESILEGENKNCQKNDFPQNKS